MKKTIYLLALPFLLGACGKNSDLVLREEADTTSEALLAESYLSDNIFGRNYKVKIPDYLKILGMQEPTINNEKAALGRVLFYDKNLSRDRSTACVSCHDPQKAFSDNVAFSRGIEGRVTERNSMPLANVVNFGAHYSPISGLSPALFWDDRASSVEAQSRATFANPNEMGLDMPDVVARIHEQAYYPYLWRTVYGNTDVREEQVLECLGEFVRAMGSPNSRLDQALTKVSGDLNFSLVNTDTIIFQAYYGNPDTTITTVITGLPGFTPGENRGRDIFVSNCSRCHSPIRPFQEVFAACNGLEENYADQGLGALTGIAADNGVFKSPSLRNITLTAPYMHDGRFKTLREVVDFYSDGVKNHPNLHPAFRERGNDPNLHLNAQQKEDLLAFLHTLTDISLSKDQKFTNPFK